MSVALGMAVGHGPEAAALKIERKLIGLKALCVNLEQEEALADSAAFRTEQRFLRLGRQKKNDDLDFDEAWQWLDYLAQDGAAGLCVDTRRVENAWWTLGVIFCQTLRICNEVHLLYERRKHYCAREEAREVAGHELAVAIKQVQHDLAGLQNP